MYRREVEEKIKKIINTFRVLVVTGPRQVGKSTLLDSLKPENMESVTLDDETMRSLAKNDPKQFLASFKKPLFIDEIQYAPELFSYIKMESIGSCLNLCGSKVSSDCSCLIECIEDKNCCKDFKQCENLIEHKSKKKTKKSKEQLEKEKQNSSELEENKKENHNEDTTIVNNDSDLDFENSIAEEEDDIHKPLESKIKIQFLRVFTIKCRKLRNLNRRFCVHIPVRQEKCSGATRKLRKRLFLFRK